MLNVFRIHELFYLSMRALIHETTTGHTPESLVERLRGEPGVVLLRSALFDSPQARCSFVACRPFLTFRSCGSQCWINEPRSGARHPVQFGNPWHLLDQLMSRCELLEEVDLPFPLGGCFGFWGYDLKNFVEPKLPRRAINDLELPDCHVGFHDSLVVFDHRLGKTWIIATGVAADGSRAPSRAEGSVEFWQQLLQGAGESERRSPDRREGEAFAAGRSGDRRSVVSNLSREQFLAAVQRAQAYIRAGDIYQVNLSQRLSTP